MFPSLDTAQRACAASIHNFWLNNLVSNGSVLHCQSVHGRRGSTLTVDVPAMLGGSVEEGRVIGNAWYLCGSGTVYTSAGELPELWHLCNHCLPSR